PDQIPPADRLLVSSAGRAAALLSESRYDQAFPIFDQLIQKYPNTPFLHFAYGAALASSSNYDRARTQLLEEARLNATTSLPYVRLASISLKLHDPDQALQFSQKALEITPESAESHYMMGRSLLEIGNPAGAVEALEIARRLAPTSPEVRFNLARAYTKTHRLEEAQHERSEFERLQAENPQTPTEHMGGQPPHSYDPMAGAAPAQN
ncbi:MAG: tetratricopeptide repeat protein, partial [Acidobacteria bacterium]|nr:tetratricopeptide repeat protein [Acidobacteriota bacterium]